MDETMWLVAAAAGLIASAVGALALAIRAAAPLRADRVERTGSASSRARLMVAARSAFVLLTTGGTLAAIAAVAQATNNLTPEVGYVLPLVATVTGLLSYAFIRSRAVAHTGTSSAALVPRTSSDFVTRRSTATPRALALLLVVVVLASAISPAPYVPYRGAGVALVVVLAGAVVLAARLALNRLVLLPALPPAIGALDSDRRRVGGRLLTLVASWGLLATTAFIGLEAGVGLWMNSPVLFQGPAVGAGIALGIGLTVVGAVTAFASVVTALATITATISTAVRAITTPAAAAPVTVTT